ncbi:SDR family oxidoreductase [Nocardiopsis sp. EMB25]|uniref:SDR family oxidoreductase n=1 Tax=Nocardiopsis sp. EMB25 TaxID=2835867 RepID=UPI0022841E92|nr:SDR family oxidoreductase [Nocardiopsis sp. EMB25]MCY9783693.1 SDR family oxidoreductase [Nocardiopsis sp. EMB25]
MSAAMGTGPVERAGHGGTVGGVVVTGATGGIGSAVVGALTARGRRVFALGRDPEHLAALAGDHPGVEPVVADLRRPESLAEAVAGFEGLDALVHCAGIAPVAPVEASPPSLWHETLTVNLVSAAELTRVLLPSLRARAGHVVFVNAAPGLHGVPSWSAYAASKAGLGELADSLRAEEAEHGVRVTSVHPAGTATDLLRRTRAAFGHDYDPDTCIRPETVASTIVGVLDLPRDTQVGQIALRPGPRGPRQEDPRGPGHET